MKRCSQSHSHYSSFRDYIGQMGSRKLSNTHLKIDYHTDWYQSRTPSRSRPSRSKPFGSRPSDTRNTKPPKSDYEANMAERLEEDHRKLVDEHILANLEEIFKSKKVPFHKNLLKNISPLLTST